jgi:hypothetical protein
MKRIVLIAGAALFAADFFGAGAGRALAQIPQYQAGPQTGSGGPSLKRSTRPAVSAYTGLLGSSVGAQGGVGYQYFTRVQPQVSTARQLRNLSGSVNRLQSSTGYAANLSPLQQQLLMQQQGLGLSLGPTGHATGYLSHTRYFGTNLQGGTVLSSGTGGLGGISGSSPGFGSAGVSSGSQRRY